MAPSGSLVCVPARDLQLGVPESRAWLAFAKWSQCLQVAVGCRLLHPGVGAKPGWAFTRGGHFIPPFTFLEIPDDPY